jgi:hypothetical protein
MLIDNPTVGAGWLRQLLTQDELSILGSSTTGPTGSGSTSARTLTALQQFRLLVACEGRLLPQPDLGQVDWEGLQARAARLQTPAWQTRMQASAVLHAQLLTIFEAATGLTRPSAESARAAFLLNHEWVRPLRTLYQAVGSDIEHFTAMVKRLVAQERLRGGRVCTPLDIRQVGVNLAAREYPAVANVKD